MCRGAVMAQWWAPPMRPGFDASLVSYVDWVWCTFSSCSDGFSPGTSNSNSTRIEDRVKTSYTTKADVASFLIIEIYLMFKEFKRQGQ